VGHAKDRVQTGLMMKKLLLIVALFSAMANAQDKQVDYVNLGATLIKDGYLQRAKTVLDKIDVTDKNFDFARYYTLKGILLHRLGYPRLSNIFFQASVDKGQDNNSIFLYVARNNWQLNDYAGVVSALDRAGESAKDSEQMFVIKAEAYKQQQMMREAWQALDEGISRFPEYARFYSQKFYYLLELGYFQHALEYAQKFLTTQNHTAKDYLAISYALRENGQYDAAAALLEEAVLKNGRDTKLIELLGQVYIDRQNYIAAALVYDWASIEFPQFANKAATLYLKSGLPIRSLQLNRRIIKQDEKFRQRLGIDIQLDDYETLVAKLPALKRYGLLAEDDIKYALGYAYFRNGDFDNAKTFLKQIADDKMFRKASIIFQQIEKCQNEPFECI
jgi:tetratricopeptide (TPR) repeat protein